VRALAVHHFTPETGSQRISSESDSAALAPLLAPLAYVWPMSSGVEDTTKAWRRPKGTGTVRQLGQGKWQLRVFVGTDTETGRPCQVSRFVAARNKTEAQRKPRQWQEELADSEPMGAGNATVRSLIEEWLRHSAARGVPRGPFTTPGARPRR
jgi:hypothetical protein